MAGCTSRTSRASASKSIAPCSSNTGARLRLFLAAARHPVDALLHLVELALQVVHFVATAGRGRLVRRGAGWLGLLRTRERREHGEGLLEHLHVAADLLFHRSEAGTAEGLRHLFAELVLMAGQRLHRL